MWSIKDSIAIWRRTILSKWKEIIRNASNASCPSNSIELRGFFSVSFWLDFVVLCHHENPLGGQFYRHTLPLKCGSACVVMPRRLSLIQMRVMRLKRNARRNVKYRKWTTTEMPFDCTDSGFYFTCFFFLCWRDTTTRMERSPRIKVSWVNNSAVTVRLRQFG